MVMRDLRPVREARDNPQMSPKRSPRHLAALSKKRDSSDEPVWSAIEKKLSAIGKEVHHVNMVEERWRWRVKRLEDDLDTTRRAKTALEQDRVPPEVLADVKRQQQMLMDRLIQENTALKAKVTALDKRKESKDANGS